jgi:hypothetical protein
MLSVLLDVRRARQRRLTLVALAACALALPFAAWMAPRLAPVLAPPQVFPVVLGALALVSSTAAAAWAGREAHWTLADDIAWSISLAAFAVLGGLGTAPVTLAMLVYGAASILLAVRVPPTRLVLVAALSAPLTPLARLASGASITLVQASILVSTLVLLAHVMLARAAHALAYVLAEREALLAERRTLTRPRDATRERLREPDTSAAAPSSIRPPRLRLSAPPIAEAKADDTAPRATSDEHGWDHLIERVRSSVTTLCEPAGVLASVHAEVQGLCPPNSRMRQNVLKIAQEAANHALRDTSPRSIAITLRRGDGGLLLEVLDDGRVGEAVRSRRALPALRGRVAPLGGSAELRRADEGWMVRVKLPCDQLN